MIYLYIISGVVLTAYLNIMMIHSTNLLLSLLKYSPVIITVYWLYGMFYKEGTKLSMHYGIMICISTGLAITVSLLLQVFYFKQKTFEVWDLVSLFLILTGIIIYISRKF